MATPAKRTYGDPRFKFHALMLFRKGMKTKEIHNSFIEVPHGPTYATVAKWVRDFKTEGAVGDDGFLDLALTERKQIPGRPLSNMHARNIDSVRSLIESDGHLTVREIQYWTGIPKSSVQMILKHDLHLRKICARWVPHKLTDDQKRDRVDKAHQMLELFNGPSGNLILRSLTTGDETWISFFTVGSKQSHMVWLPKGASRPPIVRKSLSTRKRMFVFFFGASGADAMIWVPAGQTVNSTFYVESVLKPLVANLENRDGPGACDGRAFHHDNARPHTSRLTTAFLESQQFSVVPHPPNSPDLAPADFFAFPYLKKQLEKKSFETVQGLSKAVAEILRGIPQERYEKVFMVDWKHRLERVIEAEGDYFERT